jgi:hypothetical protein
METLLTRVLLGEGFLASEVNACFIPRRGSPEAVNCEVRQQYPLLLAGELQLSYV